MTNDKDESVGAESSQFIPNRNAEPQVICYELLHRLIREQGYKGEAGRLCRDMEINLQNITVLKIESQNILLIDHLWKLANLQKLSLKCNKIDKIENLDMLTSLQELDLSFNFIERIENLECLTKLEFLSLFGNRISKIENLDALVNLVRLSLGNNQIDSLKNIERLRFMSKLYSLNLEGNPAVTNFCRPVPFPAYVAAILPKLKYYNYQRLTDDDRAESIKKFRSELRAIEEAEMEEIEKRNRINIEAEEEIRLSTCFVEFLNDHQLFDSLFVGDNSINDLLAVDGATDLVKVYREQVYESTQKIFQLGIEKHASRMENIAEFNEAIDVGIRQSQMEGIRIVNKFLDAEQANKDSLEQLHEQVSGENDDELNDDRIASINQSINAVIDEFTTLLDEAWYNLMDLEMSSHERIEEANASFAHAIQDMLHEFVENAQLHFVEISEAEIEFSDRLHELVSNWLSKRAASDVNDQGIKKFQMEKDQLSHKIATSREFRNQVIDKREEKLVSRSRAWVTKIMEDNNLNERTRNRAKLVEIHEFIEEHRASYGTFVADLTQ